MDALSRNHRYLLAFAPDPNDPELIRFRDAVAAHREAIQDRDLVVQESPGAGSDVEWRGRYRVPPDRLTLILVGKDGVEKRRDDRAVPLEEIFALIDAMPMRRREMRERT